MTEEIEKEDSSLIEETLRLLNSATPEPLKWTVKRQPSVSSEATCNRIYTLEDQSGIANVGVDPVVVYEAAEQLKGLCVKYGINGCDVSFMLPDEHGHIDYRLPPLFAENHAALRTMVANGELKQALQPLLDEVQRMHDVKALNDVSPAGVRWEIDRHNTGRYKIADFDRGITLSLMHHDLQGAARVFESAVYRTLGKNLYNDLVRAHHGEPLIRDEFTVRHEIADPRMLQEMKGEAIQALLRPIGEAILARQAAETRINRTGDAVRQR